MRKWIVKHLPLINVVRRVIVVGGLQLGVQVPLLDDGVAGEPPGGSVGLEEEAVGAEFSQVLELPEVTVEQGRRNVLKVYPEGEPPVLDVLEYGPLRVTHREERRDVARRAAGRGRVDEEPVRLGGGRHRREPPVG